MVVGLLYIEEHGTYGQSGVSTARVTPNTLEHKKKRERARDADTLHLKTSRDHNYSILYVLVRVYVYVCYGTRKIRTLENSELPTVFVLCVIYGNWPGRRSFGAPCAGSAPQIAPVLGVSHHDIQGGNSWRCAPPAEAGLERSGTASPRVAVSCHGQSATTVGGPFSK